MCVLGQDSGHLARAADNLEMLQLADEMRSVTERGGFQGNRKATHVMSSA